MNHSENKSSATTYQRSGVDVELADKLIRTWQSKIATTMRPERIHSDMGFAGLFELPSGYDSPVLVSGADGVGTKLKLAFALNHHHSVGIDLVAMCVNDVLVCGAEPLFFLDYFATGQLSPDITSRVIDGVVDGCNIAAVDLIGGETAQMPGMYADGEYDLAGFCVGIVEKNDILGADRVAIGDVVVGISSSGFHSNGYSLIRKVIEDRDLSLADSLDGQLLSERLMAPTIIYVQPVLDACKVGSVHALAHITGGGLPGNLERVVPHGLSARLDIKAWSRPAVFGWIQEQGGISEDEMLSTFNCGIGMTAVVAQDSEIAVRTAIEKHGIQTNRIGIIEAGCDQKVILD